MDHDHDRDKIDRDEALTTSSDARVDDSSTEEVEHHATTGGAAAAGAMTGGVIGLAGGPIGVALGAVGGALVGAAAERVMHADDDNKRAAAGLGNDGDSNLFIETKDPRMPAISTESSGTVTAEHSVEVPVGEDEVAVYRVHTPVDRQSADELQSDHERAGSPGPPPTPVRDEKLP